MLKTFHHFTRKYRIDHRNWTPVRPSDQFVSLGSSAFMIQNHHNMYGLYSHISSPIWGDLANSSQAHIHPESVLFNEVTIFEAPTRASIVRANTEARFVSDWPIADAGTLLPAVYNIRYFNKSSSRDHLLDNIFVKYL